MALAFPLSTAAFMDLLGVGEITFDAPPQVEANGTGGGEIMTAELGPMRWTGSVSLGALTLPESATPEVLLDVLGPPGRSFYAYDTRRPAPLADPTGTILGAATPSISTLHANNRDIALTGLPAGYVLTRGDYLAFTASGSRALHRIVTASVTANGAGTTPNFEVTPRIRPGASIGLAVTLVKASCKAVLVPGSVSKGRSGKTITREISFRFSQTLR